MMKPRRQVASRLRAGFVRLEHFFGGRQVGFHFCHRWVVN